MIRYLHEQILKDLKKKMVFITGPRQVGKTYLSKQIIGEFKNPQYLNYDNDEHRRVIKQQTWKMNVDLIVFDEIHKMSNWKSYIKGVYDTKPETQSILVTGSARLETYRQSGDSLAGRYFHIRLYPLSVKEAEGILSPYEAIERLNKLGGFPEPFLSGSDEEAARWRNQYFTDLMREDILDYSRIHEIKTMRYLLEILRSRVGSLLSFNSLAEDLQVSPNTIKKYIHILESLYIIFLIRPYHKNIGRSILREPKLYFYDSGHVKGDEGIRLENTCAVCLQKYVHYQHDVKGEDISLHYLKTKDGKEVDLCIIKNDLPAQLIEIKLSETIPTRSLIYFSKQLPGAEAFQLVHNLRVEENNRGIALRKAGEFLSKLPV